MAYELRHFDTPLRKKERHKSRAVIIHAAIPTVIKICVDSRIIRYDFVQIC
jgi:hypothetical protein